MMEVVYGWRSLDARHTVEKLGLIALLYQASHFPVFDWLFTSLKYLTHSANMLIFATQVYLPCHCGAAARFYFPGGIARAFGPLTLDGNGCRQPLYVFIGPPRGCAGGSFERRDCTRRTHAPSRPISPHRFVAQ